MDLTPYVPQLITALATLGGVVLTLVFTGKREESRWKKQRRWEIDKALFDSKRLAFINFNRTLKKVQDALQASMEHARAPTAESRQGFSAAVSELDEAGDALFDLAHEIRLVAPEVHPALYDVLQAISTWPAEGDLKAMDLAYEEFLEKGRICRQAMRKSLGIEEVVEGDHNQPQLNEINPSGTPKPIQP